MKAILSLPHPGKSAANPAPQVNVALPPGLTLLGFRDADRLAFRDLPLQQRNETPAAAKADRGAAVHGVFSALVAVASIALLAFGR